MKNYNSKYLVYSFYRFTHVKDISNVKKQLDFFLKDKKMRGTLLISKEGVNGSISGVKNDLDNFLKVLKKLLKIKKIEINTCHTNFLPFKRLKIRLKNEIVTLAQGLIDINKYRGKLIDPRNWNNIISSKETKLIDVRNDYEIDIGRFKYSMRPNTNNFRDFPKVLKKLKIDKKDKIAMYCTGGVRCEKASAYLRSNGFKNIVQLKGGILNYLDYTKKKKKNSLWQGECFVFDDRVTVNKDLKKGKYLQCHGCRRPITTRDTKSIYYKKGVTCPLCVHERSSEQKKRSLARQDQIERAEEKKEDHPFKKIK